MSPEDAGLSRHPLSSCASGKPAENAETDAQLSQDLARVLERKLRASARDSLTMAGWRSSCAPPPSVYLAESDGDWDFSVTFVEPAPATPSLSTSVEAGESAIWFENLIIRLRAFKTLPKAV